MIPSPIQQKWKKFEKTLIVLGGGITQSFISLVLLLRPLSNPPSSSIEKLNTMLGGIVIGWKMIDTSLFMILFLVSITW